MSRRNGIVRATWFALTLLFLTVLVTPISAQDEPPPPETQSIILTAATLADAKAAANSVGAEITHKLGIINAVGATVTQSQLDALASMDQVVRISSNAVVQASNTFETVRDDFNMLDYNNNVGTQSWVDAWREYNDDGNTRSGNILHYWGVLVLKNNDRSIERTVDLSAANSAMLTFDYGRWSFEDADDYVMLQIQAGGDWVELDRYSGPASSFDRFDVSYDISEFAGGEAQIRFVTSPELSQYDSFSVDNVEIAYLFDDLTEEAPEPADDSDGLEPDNSAENQFISDTFAEKSFGGNDGTVAWSADWVEGNDWGLSHWGDIRVDADLLIIAGNNETVQRMASLVDASDATLSVHTACYSMRDADEWVELEISADFGTTWTKLDRFETATNCGDDMVESTYALADYVGEEIMLRFATSDGMSSFDALLVDEVTITLDVQAAEQEEQEAERVIEPIAAMIGADELHEEGITGAGVTVAIIDTGFAAFDAVNLNRSGETRVLAQYDAINNIITKGLSNPDITSDDESGHGLHISSIIANSDVDDQGRSLGVAPDADLVLVKAFAADGSGTYADVIRGIDTLVRYKDAINLRVINLSFYSTPQSHYWEDPLNQAVMRAWQAGIVVVTGAGNAGPDALSIGVPGNVPYVITVGAMTDNYTPDDTSDDYIPPFSSAGPSPDGFIKPEIVAPGAHILGLVETGSTIAQNYPQFAQTADYYTLSGTSMSAAATSGVVALMLQNDPSLTPDDVKCRLIDSAAVALNDNGELAYSIFQQGAGVVNAVAAVNSTANGCANGGLDINADIEGTDHFVGPVVRNSADQFVILDENGNENLHWDGAYAQSGGSYLWVGGSYLWVGGSYLWTGGSYLWVGGSYLWVGGSYLWVGSETSWTSGSYLWVGSEFDPLINQAAISIVTNP